MHSFKSIASAFLLACAAMSAHAGDISAPTKLLTLDADGFAAFGDKFQGNKAGSTFSDKFTFTTTSLSNLTAEVTSYDKNNGALNLTGFSLFSNLGQVVGGTQLSTGTTDHWSLSYDNLAVGSYYLLAVGNIAGKSAITYSGNLSLDAVSAVPEPETYAMLLGGLGILAVSARRRKQKQA